MEIKDFRLMVFLNDQENEGSNVVLANENFKLKVDVFEYDYITSNSKQLSLFTSNATATSCENKGYFGLKPKIDSIKIFSNNLFNGIDPGKNLNSAFVSQYFEYQDQIRKEIVGDLGLLKTYLNNSEYHINQGYLKMIDKPKDSLIHQFKVQIYFENKTLERKSVIIHFRD